MFTTMSGMLSITITHSLPTSYDIVCSTRLNLHVGIVVPSTHGQRLISRKIEQPAFLHTNVPIKYWKRPLQIYVERFYNRSFISFGKSILNAVKVSGINHSQPHKIKIGS